MSSSSTLDDLLAQLRGLSLSLDEKESIGDLIQAYVSKGHIDAIAVASSLRVLIRAASNRGRLDTVELEDDFRLTLDDLEGLLDGDGYIPSWEPPTQIGVDDASLGVFVDIGPIESGYHLDRDTALYGPEFAFTLAAAAPDLLHDLLLAHKRLRQHAIERKIKTGPGTGMI